MTENDGRTTRHDIRRTELDYAESELAIVERERALDKILELMKWHGITLAQLADELCQPGIQTS